jgi:hypothetical protein
LVKITIGYNLNKIGEIINSTKNERIELIPVNIDSDLDRCEFNSPIIQSYSTTSIGDKYKDHLNDQTKHLSLRKKIAVVSM